MNLLSDSIFRCEPKGCRTLSELFFGLAQGDIRAFTSLRPHQRAAWHMFLVQLGTIAVENFGWPRDPKEWETAIRSLTEFGDDPWKLVVDDRSRPAFFQPPDPGGLNWNDVPTPDALDMLISSKNHDLKAQVAADARSEDWVFALVTLQTMEGYGGAGNFGIARMNGGSSSRPMLAAAPVSEHGCVDLSLWWRRDVERLLDIRTKKSESVGEIGGQALLWCTPWPECQQLEIADLDPLFLEVCRRIRLFQVSGKIKAERSTSKKARINAKAFKGVLGDPWAPIHRVESKALSLGARDFDYRTIRDLLYGDWAIPLLAKQGPGEQSDKLVLVAEAISRGNSRTDGLKRRVIPLPKSGWYAEDTASTADAMIDEIHVIDTALRDSIAIFVARGVHGKVGKAERLAAADARRRFDQSTDRIFFQSLWQWVEAERLGDSLPAQTAFRNQLIHFAYNELKSALYATPISQTWAPRARVRALKCFRNVLFKSGKLLEFKHV
ncbi:MAG: hypothetical protein J4F49_12300 [Rhodobacteraceae bacterium]|nr:hypothetical protein [Paracoccaceae bacterium]